MGYGFPRLLGDIGGTNARWAWQADAHCALQDISVLPCDASASLQESAFRYLAARGTEQPRTAAIGIATAVTGDEVRFTNNAWAFSIQAFQRALGLEHCLVINDFTALAMSLPALAATDLQAVGAGRAVANAPMALIGPGTGLGVSGLASQGPGQWSALSGEGGHATVAAADDFESDLLAVLRRQFDHVSAERVLSGNGLINLYNAVCALEGVVAAPVEAADVTDRALARSDAQCERAVQLFASFLGNVAGNLALTLGARGGVYIGGGIVPRLGASFDSQLFRRRFEEKGRFQEYLRPIPTWIITAQTPALIGASRALDFLPG